MSGAIKNPARRAAWRRAKLGYGFMLPFLVLYGLFTVVPILMAIFTSFTRYSVLEPPVWIGLTNYKLLIFDDEIFLTALRNTLVFAVAVGPTSFILSFLLAWIINNLKGKSWFALAVYTPSIASAVAVSAIWGYFFSPDRYGLVNNFLIELGIVVRPVAWTQNAQTILPVVMLISVWMGMGTGFLAFLAGFQNVSKELLEAGRIDGVNGMFAELWLIIVPQMKPQLLFGAVMAIVSSFGVFDVPVQFAGLPSPNYAAHTVVAHLYDYSFTRFQMGYGAAVAVVLLIMTYVLGRVVMRVLKNDDV